MPKVLVISYSQTGQLHEIIANFLKPFPDTVDIDRVIYEPVKDFPFPWSKEVFYNTMPECVTEVAVPLKPMNFKHEQYDLILLGYQPWFLSPSVPVSSLLQHPDFLKRVANTKVITISGCRNMWLNAQESIKIRLKNAGAQLVGNIPLVDRNNNHISVVTIFHWMIGGKKDRKWNLLPLPGVSEKDILSAERFGEITLTALNNNNFDGLQEKFLSLGIIQLPTEIVFIEERAKRLFRIWAKIIITKGTTPKKRAFLVKGFEYYLMIALFGAAPLLFGLYSLLIRPFVGASIKKKKEYYLSTQLR